MTDTSKQPYIYLAPLRGVTDVLFRDTFSKHFGGFDSSIAPFLNPQQNSSKKKHLLADLFPEDNKRLPVIPQLLNNRASEFIMLARQLEDLGYTQLNWNLGCPSPMVANKRRGSGLLPYPDDILALLDEVLPQIKATLSIKMRLGYRENSESAYLLPRLNDYPLNEIIVHPRLGKQMYKGQVDLEGFEESLELIEHPVVYNGDITSARKFAELQDRFPQVERWMIGRGVLMYPYLAEDIKGIGEQDPEKRALTIRSFHDDMYRGYRAKLSGPGHVLGKMKQLWLYLYLSFPGKEKVLKKIKKARTLEQLDNAVAQMFLQQL